MTNREFFNAVANNEITEEVKAHAVQAIAKLDSANEKKKNSESAVQKANKELMAQLLPLITETPQPAAVFAEMLGTSTAKIASLMSKLSAENKVVREEIKVNKRKTSGYRLPKED